MSKKFLITEEERNHIINLYSNKGIVLNEQKNNKPVKQIQSITKNDVQVEYPDFNLITEKNVLLVLDLCKDDTSASLWEKITRENKDKYLIASTIDAVLNPEDRKKVTKVVIVKTGEETKTIKPKGVDTKPPIKTPGIDFPKDMNTKTSDWFCNNSWTLTKNATSDIEASTIQPIIDAMSNAKQLAVDDLVKQGVEDAENMVTVSACLKSLSIETSCSRYVNTGNAKDKTFLELSTLRGQSVDAYLRKRLGEMGIIGCDTSDNSFPETVFNPNGQNGDGSSGPNPPARNRIPVSGKEGDYNKDESKRNEFGAPLAGKPETNSCNESTNGIYNQFKYAKVNLTIGIQAFALPSTITPQPKEVPPQIIKTPLYRVTLLNKNNEETPGDDGSSSRRRHKWNMRWAINLFKLFGGMFKGKTKMIDCPNLSMEGGPNSPEQFRKKIFK